MSRIIEHKDKIGDHRDWQDGHDAFRRNTIKAIKVINNRINALELIIEEQKENK